MYFSLYSLFPFFHTILLTLLFPVIKTPVEDFQEQRYANKFIVDHVVSFMLNNFLSSCPLHTFVEQTIFKLKYVSLGYRYLKYLSKLFTKLFKLCIILFLNLRLNCIYIYIYYIYVYMAVRIADREERNKINFLQ